MGRTRTRRELSASANWAFVCGASNAAGAREASGAWGAAFGTVSLRAGPVASLALGGGEVFGMMLATAAGVAFQYSLEAPEEEDEKEEDESDD